MTTTISGTLGVDLVQDGAIGTAKLAASSVTAAKLAQPLTLGVAISSTTGTFLDFTSIPSWVRRITLSMAGVSTNGTDNWLVQIGDAGGIETTGYTSQSIAPVVGAGTSGAIGTTGFILLANNAAERFHGTMVLTLVDPAAQTWVASHSACWTTTAVGVVGGGSKSLSPGPLDRVRLTTTGGVNTFDLGVVNIMYE